MNHVNPLGGAIRHAKADDVRHSGGDSPLNLFRWKAITAAIVLERFLTRFCLAAPLLELGRSAEAAVGGADFKQLASVGLMTRQIGALIDDAVVPVQSEPLQSLENRTRTLFSTSRLVGVFDAKQELPAEFPGVEPVEERGAGAANVQISCWRRCEAKASLC